MLCFFPELWKRKKTVDYLSRVEENKFGESLLPIINRHEFWRKLAVQAFVFHLWKQRNNLIHNQTSRTAASVFHDIDKEMRNLISARRKRKHFQSLMIMWLR